MGMTYSMATSTLLENCTLINHCFISLAKVGALATLNEPDLCCQRGASLKMRLAKVFVFGESGEGI